MRRSIVLVLVAFGCAATPTAAGHDASVSGTWRVEGAAPTSATCADVGIDTVRIAIYAPSGVEYLDRLEAPCATGMLDTITPVLSAGTYQVAWEGFRGGVRIAQGSRHSVSAMVGGRVVVPSVDFTGVRDPSGTDASVSAHWTIQGVAATSRACQALGIARVRVAVLQGSRAIQLAPLTAACSVGVIDTRPVAVLAAGSARLQLQALDAHDMVLFAGAMAMTTVPAGPAHVALYDDVPVDIASSTFEPRGGDATVSYAWTLDHTAPSIDLCDAVGAAAVHLVLYDAADTAMTHGVSVAQASCQLAMFESGSSAIVRAGSYLASIEARDATGATRAVAIASRAPVTVTAGSRWALPVVDLAFPTTLTVTLDWALPTMSGSGTCRAAGVATMSYALVVRASGATIAQQASVPCAERLSFDAMRTPGFSGATYDLSVTGTTADHGHAWRTGATRCTGIVVADGSIVSQGCVVASL